MILKRYILKEHISPFLISLLVVTFVLLIDRIIDLMNLIIEKQLPLGIVLEVFGLSLPYMLALSIPMAVLVATILAFGRMSVDREIIAVKSSGVNIYSMLTLLIIAAVLLTGLMVYFNHWFLPNTNHKLKNLMLKVAYYKPMTIIEAGEYNYLLDYTVWCGENTEEELRDVIIYDRSESRFPRTIYAESGNVIQMNNGNALRITLLNGQMQKRNEQEAGKYQTTIFAKYVINVKDLGNRTDMAETGYRSDREMTYEQLTGTLKDRKKELSEKMEELKKLESRIAAGTITADPYASQTEQRRLHSMKQVALNRIQELEANIRALEVEYHKKFALSFAIIIFIMIGVPLGLMTRTSGIGMAFSVSSVIFLIYYVALNMGEQLADKGSFNPFFSMWFSNIIFFVLALLLIWGSIREKRLFDTQVLLWRLKHLKNRKSPPPDEVVH
ncbi:MAG: LptF/LptG family permease [Candidatus Cloacimonadales bacterium]|jgi:lipopolysaccharide export system permease protein|nr:LptF/LptG family permease [Candidatus Cloacimonadota bacterium]MDY0380741.1 LptF/LptG family permease [Candidatus Cloacimonadaceae bacterium]MCB5255945.1 LptF/LptG family permease [Candidatus Cloacimonadota bacterium]MCB5264477.1 LptF/LptG family permease [Candidatus Cloacimonadota bacterium]MCB5276553.1 LptF/LptG family permease [Candidatus Cloacimonadota bacterium]